MALSLRGADIVARSLANAGVDRIFALSGNHIMSIFDATLDAGIEIVHVRHEAAAVHMADAWSRLTGKVGIALLTGGPGHANGVSALYTALASESAVVMLSGHAPLDQLGSGAFQEMRQANMAAPVTKAAWTTRDVAGLGEDMARALRLAAGGRPGPVHVSLPTNLLDAVVDSDAIALPPAGAFSEEPRPLPAPLAADIAQALGEAKRPLILTGPYAASAAAGRMTADLAAASGIPVVTMESPRGVKDPCLGAFAQMLARADCVLLLGKQPDFTLGFARPPVFAADCQLLQIDPDQLALTRLSAATEHFTRLPRQVRAHPRASALTLAQQFAAPHPSSAWHDAVNAAIAYRPEAWSAERSPQPETLHPVELCRAVQSLLDAHPDAVLICDGGEFSQWAQACLHAGRRVINGPAGSIGSALAFAAAARMACPEALVIAIQGDGTIGFHLSEFDTAVRYNLPFVTVVGNDACWNAEYQIQLREYGPERAVGCELGSARYDLVAQALGGHGAQVTGAQELPGALAAAVASGRPACINVAVGRLPAPMIRQPE